MKSKVINFALFQAAWFGCVLSAAKGYWWMPPICAVFVCAAYLLMREDMIANVRTLAIIVVIGTVIDLVLWRAKIVGFAQPQANFISIAAWFASLWASFATTLRLSMSWLRSRYVVSAIFGAIGGPLAYLAGERLGALILPSKTLSLIVLAGEWAVLTPLVMWVAFRDDRKESVA
ncbi:MAG: DUF2878 domain-containing protein [Phycisphaerales bacterium]